MGHKLSKKCHLKNAPFFARFGPYFPELYRKYRKIMIFSSFSRFWPLYHGNNPIKPGLRLFTILRRLFQKKFFQKFSTILALWCHLDPQKRTFWAFWAFFFADFRIFDHYNIKIIPKTMVEIAHSIQEITLK